MSHKGRLPASGLGAKCLEKVIQSLEMLIKQDFAQPMFSDRIFCYAQKLDTSIGLIIWCFFGQPPHRGAKIQIQPIPERQSSRFTACASTVACKLAVKASAPTDHPERARYPRL